MTASVHLPMVYKKDCPRIWVSHTLLTYYIRKVHKFFSKFPPHCIVVKHIVNLSPIVQSYEEVQVLRIHRITGVSRIGYDNCGFDSRLHSSGVQKKLLWSSFFCILVKQHAFLMPCCSSKTAWWPVFWYRQIASFVERLLNLAKSSLFLIYETVLICTKRR